MARCRLKSQNSCQFLARFVNSVNANKQARSVFCQFSKQSRKPHIKVATAKLASRSALN